MKDKECNLQHFSYIGTFSKPLAFVTIFNNTDYLYGSLYEECSSPKYLAHFPCMLYSTPNVNCTHKFGQSHFDETETSSLSSKKNI